MFLKVFLKFFVSCRRASVCCLVPKHIINKKTHYEGKDFVQIKRRFMFFKDIEQKNVKKLLNT